MNAHAIAADTCAPTTAIAVANEFLSLVQQEPNVPPVDQMKLQKLVFYAHAWHLGYDKGPLFDNDVEAWPWGPVVRDVYTQTVEFGRAPVSGRLWEFGKDGLGQFVVVTPDGVPASLKDYVQSVWDVHKGLTGIQLSNSTHAPGEPWTLVRDKIGTSTKPTIPNRLIADVFKEKLVRNAAAANPPA